MVKKVYSNKHFSLLLCIRYRFTVTHATDLSKINKDLERSGRQKKRDLPCRMCNKIYKYDKTRINHEIKKHNYTHDQNNDLKVLPENENNKDNDHILAYQKALLTFNLTLRNINDCIREGDGERLIECYKFALLCFRNFGHTKYAKAVLKLIFEIKSNPDKAFRLIWGRFVNNSGMIGKNISLDLHLEHLNKFLKELLMSLRSNLNENNADRISKSVRNTSLIVENVEKNLVAQSKQHSKNTHDAFADVKRLSMEYKKSKVFVCSEGREYESFPKFNEDIFYNMDTTALFKWLKEKKEELA